MLQEHRVKRKYLCLSLEIVLCMGVASNALAGTADAGIVAEIVKTFYTEANSWFSIFQNVARNVFYWVAVLEIAYIGIRSVLGLADIKDTIKEFMLMLLAAGFFLAVINNYQEWSNMLIRGLYNTAGQVIPLQASSDNPFKTGLELLSVINQQVDGLSFMSDGGQIFALYIASFIVLVCFALITAQIIIIKCEAIIAVTASVILVAFGATKFLRDYAINTIRYIFSVAFKLFVLQLIIGVGFGFINRIKNVEMDMNGIAVTIGFVVVLFAITRTLPDTVAGIINGAHTGSGGATMQSTTGAALGALMGSAAGAYTGASAVKTSHELAKAEGASGFSNTAKSMGKNLLNAAHASSANKSTIRRELKDRLSQMTDLNK
jgi:type IV secretion system protein TrbL